MSQDSVSITIPANAATITNYMNMETPSWNGYKSPSQTAESAVNVLTYNNEISPSTQCTFVPATGRMTVTVAGRYFIYISSFGQNTASTQHKTSIRINRVIITDQWMSAKPANDYSSEQTVTCMRDLAVGEFVEAYIEIGQVHQNANCSFGGYRIGVASSVISPVVLSVSPVHAEEDVLVTSTVNTTFNKSIDPLTITTSTFQLRNGVGSLVAGATSYNSGSKTATFTPSSNMTSQDNYTATIISGGSGVKDTEGNEMLNDYAWAFTIQDITPPTVTSTNPANGQPGVPTNALVLIYFSEPMDPSTINTTTITISPNFGANSVTYPYSGNDTIAAFNPTHLLSTSPHTVTVLGGASGVKDIAGNPMTNSYLFTFFTSF